MNNSNSQPDPTSTLPKSEPISSVDDGNFPEMKGEDDSEAWELRLYVAGQSAKSMTAFANLRRICEEYMPGRYRIEVIDLLLNPQLAKGDQIVAIPTVVRKLPEPLCRLVGDLRDTERALVGLQLRPRKS